MDGLVLTVDQRASRSAGDRVPDLLTALEPLPCRLPFRRTAGDEVQALLTDPAHLAPLLERVLRSGGWRVGVGIGAVDEPLPTDVREARGPAFVHARTAVEAARHAPAGLRVHAGGSGEPDGSARALESALWLWAALLERRTDRGWEVVDLVDGGATYEVAAQRLGITQSAVSQRAQAAGLAEGRRARELVRHLAEAALGAPR